MPAKKEENKQVNVMLSSLEYKTLAIMGGATSVLKRRIELEAGDKFKLLMMKQRKLDLIVQTQQEIADIDALIKDSDRKTAEDEKWKQEQDKKNIELRTTTRVKSPSTSDKETWLESKKSTFLKYLSNGGLSEENYNLVRLYKNFRTNDEVEKWIRNE